jgi:hypothetical protein
MSDALLALAAAVAGALVALWTSERHHRLTNVTAERAAWRARVRELAADLIAGSDEDTGEAGLTVRRRRAAVVLQLSTNPFDPLDREIVELAGRIASANDPDLTETRLLALRLQLLLKHDWERAKAEASWSGTLSSLARRMTGRSERPRRPDYARFIDWRMRNPRDMDDRLPPP